MDSALRPLEDIMMRFSMHASIALVTNLPPPQQMDWLVSIMSSPELALLFYKVMRMKYLVSPSILKAIRLSQLVAIRRAGYGQQKMAVNCKC